jgi:hypothetical protein
MDPAARTASRQILRWLRDTAREDPSQLPILARDVRDGGPGGWPGPWPTPWAQTAARLLPLGGAGPGPGPHNANYGAADHLARFVLAFLHRRVLAQHDQTG